MDTMVRGMDHFRGAVADEACVIQDALVAIRKHLGMEVAYFSEFVDGRTVFRRVDAPGLEHLIKPGDSQSLDDVYCNHILEGRLPELIPDTAALALCRELPITAAVPIGSHASIPVRLKDGTPYGMFCCLSPRPNPSLNERDLETMRVYADIAAKQVNGELEHSRALRHKRAAIDAVLAHGAFAMAFQPIHDLTTLAPVGYEALCRFSAQPYRSPDRWFQDAAEVGLALELELAAIRAAVAAFEQLPRHLGLSVNASPLTAVSGRLASALDPRHLGRTVLEVTEHARVEDYAALHLALAPLKAAGMKVAIDDAGAGYSGLQHIVQLAPEIIKLDMSLTRGVDTDPARRALCSAMIHYARETGSSVVAEGIETHAEMETLRGLGVHRGQGWLLGKPGPLPA
jgi:EAL domain-containing protein (putative c-di-GMP-specific phosphodiesterase class I)